MKDLNECRKELNQIDEEMKLLFLKRQKIIKEVAEYKIANNISTYDPAREEEMKKRLAADLDAQDSADYLLFLENILFLSKRLQDKMR